MTPRTTPAAPADPRVARTRARVLSAAWEVLAEVGFERVTIDLVSERSGVARSTMYRHWQTREEILRDAFAEQAVARDREAVSAVGGREQLVAYAVTFASGLADDWGRAALTMAIRGLDEPEQRRAVLTFADGSHADLRSIVERGCDDGDLPDGTDRALATATLVDVLLAPLFYRYQVLGRPAGPEAAAELADRAWRIVGGT